MPLNDFELFLEVDIISKNSLDSTNKLINNQASKIKYLKLKKDKNLDISLLLLISESFFFCFKRHVYVYFLSNTSRSS